MSSVLDLTETPENGQGKVIQDACRSFHERNNVAEGFADMLAKSEILNGSADHHAAELVRLNESLVKQAVEASNHLINLLSSHIDRLEKRI